MFVCLGYNYFNLCFSRSTKNFFNKNSHFATLPNSELDSKFSTENVYNIRTNFCGSFGECIITDQITITRKFNGLTFFLKKNLVHLILEFIGVTKYYKHKYII